MARPVRIGLLAAGASLVALLLVAVGTVAARAQSEAPYVALGDSFTAGPFIPFQVGDPTGCRRSDHNYPHVAAAVLGLSLTDVSCSGATTADLFAPQVVTGGANPPQLDAVGPGTAVVSLGIGGNDIGFSAIVRECVAVTPLDRPCKDHFAGPGGDEITRRIADAAPRVAAALAEIRRRAPGARVFALGYPAILPEHDLGCWPVMPFAFADVPYLRAKEKELNAMIAAQAAAAGATYVDLYDPSVGHDACALPGVKWVEAILPTAPAAPVHPNASGMRGMAAALAAAVDPAAARSPSPLLRLEVELVVGAP